jgi:hypothetical protein
MLNGEIKVSGRTMADVVAAFEMALEDIKSGDTTGVQSFRIAGAQHKEDGRYSFQVAGNDEDEPAPAAQHQSRR